MSVQRSGGLMMAEKRRLAGVGRGRGLAGLEDVQELREDIRRMFREGAVQRTGPHSFLSSLHLPSVQHGPHPPRQADRLQVVTGQGPYTESRHRCMSVTGRYIYS